VGEHPSDHGNTFICNLFNSLIEEKLGPLSSTIMAFVTAILVQWEPGFLGFWVPGVMIVYDTLFWKTLFKMILDETQKGRSKLGPHAHLQITLKVADNHDHCIWDT